MVDIDTRLLRGDGVRAAVSVDPTTSNSVNSDVNSSLNGGNVSSAREIGLQSNYMWTSPYSEGAQTDHFVVVRGIYSMWLKRLADIGLSALGLLALSPVFLIIGCLVRVSLGKGVIFTQRRVGKDGVPFTIYKFRSMLPDRRVANDSSYTGPERRKTHKSSSDPRHTKFGRMLRASSLDELPQLYNVLRGDMSLIGPRPELVEVAARNGYLLHPRHLVRPGLTGSFQVSKLRFESRIAAGLQLDIDYVRRVRVLTDLRILLKTIFVLYGRGR